ncbi:MAG: dephospho-CoA kinase [Oligoflexia bacterium]|nr:dephospho-CoA kinase [Oligoflexia bacterium]
MKKAIIGITGGISSGKTAFCNALLDSGFTVINADHIVKRITRQDQPLYKKIVELAYSYNIKDIASKNNGLDRNIMRKAVFSDHSFKAEIEKLIHPQVIREIKSEISGTDNNIAVEIPLLFEAHTENLFDYIVCIYRDKSLMLNNLVSKYNITEEEAAAMLGTHMNMSFKMRNSHFVVFNNGTVKDLNKKAELLTDYLDHSGTK